MSSTYREFLKTGRLGELTIGSPKSQVLKILGEPEDRTNARQKPQIWKYGNLQIAFLKDSVVLIGIYFSEYETSLPESLRIEEDIPSYKTHLNEFKQYLLREGISFEQNAELIADNQVCILLESGIQIFFTEDMLVKILLSSLK
jgi:hypothetical protein